MTDNHLFKLSIAKTNAYSKASENVCGASDSLERKLRWACARGVFLQSEDDVPQAFATHRMTFFVRKTELKREGRRSKNK